MAAVAAAIDAIAGDRKRRISGQLVSRNVTRDVFRIVRLGSEEVALTIAKADGGFSIAFDGDRQGPVRVVSAWAPGQPLWTGMVDGHDVAVQVRPVANGFALAHAGIETTAYVFTEREAAAARLMPVKALSDTGKQVLCPMPGLVRSIAVSVGQEVRAGEPLAVVEAMKMENLLRAERDGTVKKILVKPGDSLAVDAVILEFA